MPHPKTRLCDRFRWERAPLSFICSMPSCFGYGGRTPPRRCSKSTDLMYFRGKAMQVFRRLILYRSPTLWRSSSASGPYWLFRRTKTQFCSWSSSVDRIGQSVGWLPLRAARPVVAVGKMAADRNHLPSFNILTGRGSYNVSKRLRSKDKLALE
jgi:hypothetical protein